MNSKVEAALRYHVEHVEPLIRQLVEQVEASEAMRRRGERPSIEIVGKIHWLAEELKAVTVEARLLFPTKKGAADAEAVAVELELLLLRRKKLDGDEGSR